MLLVVGLPQSSRSRACDEADVRRRPRLRRLCQPVVTRDVPPGAVVAGNPARVIKQVADLTCPPGWFEHPYTWPPYAEPAPFDPGEPCDDVPPRYEPPAPRG